VLPRFEEGRARREAEKAEALGPYVEQALERKRWMASLAEEDVPLVPASREREAYYRK